MLHVRQPGLRLIRSCSAHISATCCLECWALHLHALTPHGLVVNTCGTSYPGPAEELRALLRELAAAGTFVRELETGSVAYHSPMLQPVVTELRAGELCDRHLRHTSPRDAYAVTKADRLPSGRKHAGCPMHCVCSMLMLCAPTSHVLPRPEAALGYRLTDRARLFQHGTVRLIRLLVLRTALDGWCAAQSPSHLHL